LEGSSLPVVPHDRGQSWIGHRPPDGVDAEDALQQEEEKKMNTEVEFSTSRYERMHGRKPRGYSLWYFRMPDGFTFCQEGTFPQAKQAAAAHARQWFTGDVVRVQVYI
jgi:hypothetical protein